MDRITGALLEFFLALVTFCLGLIALQFVGDPLWVKVLGVSLCFVATMFLALLGTDIACDYRFFPAVVRVYKGLTSNKETT
jgi:hypothetical protein